MKLHNVSTALTTTLPEVFPPMAFGSMGRVQAVELPSLKVEVERERWEEEEEATKEEAEEVEEEEK